MIECHQAKMSKMKFTKVAKIGPLESCDTTPSHQIRPLLSSLPHQKRFSHVYSLHFQLDFAPALDEWLKKSYPRGCCTIGSIRSHKARLYITNHSKPEHCFDCSVIWAVLFAPCWLTTAPCYKVSWAASREKVPYGLSQCHTKRRMGARGHTHPSFGVTPTF